MRLILLILLIPNLLAGQCYIPERTGNLYGVIPRFINLYNNGDCVVQDITDTTICIKVRPRTFGQLAYYSYSTPFGQPVQVQVSQFNYGCELIATDNQIYPSTDTTIVCYTINAELIDNFCPYIFRFVSLDATWCGLQCSIDSGILQVDWATCSNSNTARFEVVVSQDGINWSVLGQTAPKHVNSSVSSAYRFVTSWSIPGQFYLSVREIDLNGSETYSDVCTFTGQLVQPMRGYDLSGRIVPDNYQWKLR